MLTRIDWVQLAAMAIFLARTRIRARRRSATTIGSAIREFDRRRGCRAWRSRCSSSARSISRVTDRQAVAVPQADICVRMRVQSGDRLRHVRIDLSDSGFSRPRARLQRASKSDETVCDHRHRTDREHGDRGATVGGGRPALGDPGRADAVRVQPVADVAHDVRVGIRGTVLCRRRCADSR